MSDPIRAGETPIGVEQMRVNPIGGAVVAKARINLSAMARTRALTSPRLNTRLPKVARYGSVPAKSLAIHFCVMAATKISFNSDGMRN